MDADRLLAPNVRVQHAQPGHYRARSVAAFCSQGRSKGYGLTLCPTDMTLHRHVLKRIRKLDATAATHPVRSALNRENPAENWIGRGLACNFPEQRGTGFTRDVLASLHCKFQPLKRRQPPVEDLRRIQRATFLSPKLVAQISYPEWTKDGKLRHPVFLGLRDDKDPKDVSLPEAK